MKITIRLCFPPPDLHFESFTISRKNKDKQNKRPKGPHIVHLSTMCHLMNRLARAAILFFPIGMKNTNLVEDVEDLASCQISSDCVQQFQRRCRKGLSQSEARTAILFFRSARKTQTWQRTLRSCFLSSFVKFHSAVSDEKSKMYQPIRGQGGHLVFPIGPKNTNLVEDVEILLPVKVR